VCWCVLDLHSGAHASTCPPPPCCTNECDHFEILKHTATNAWCRWLPYGYIFSIFLFLITILKANVFSPRSLVGRPGFDSLAELDQKALKVGNHSFSAWRSACKRVNVEISRQVRLLCPWARHVAGVPFCLSG